MYTGFRMIDLEIAIRNGHSTVWVEYKQGNFWVLEMETADPEPIQGGLYYKLNGWPSMYCKKVYIPVE